MSADLHLHILKGLTEEELRIFQGPTIVGGEGDNTALKDPLYSKVAHTPNIWVGEVSWLKAMLFGDEDTFIPSPVMGVSEAIGDDLPVIDDALIARVKEALGRNNTTSYDVTKGDEVISFLESYKGERVFQVSW